MIIRFPSAPRRTSWQIIRDKGLLTEAEIRRVSDFPGTVSPGGSQLVEEEIV